MTTMRIRERRMMMMKSYMEATTPSYIKINLSETQKKTIALALASFAFLTIQMGYEREGSYGLGLAIGALLYL